MCDRDMIQFVMFTVWMFIFVIVSHGNLYDSTAFLLFIHYNYTFTSYLPTSCIQPFQTILQFLPYISFPSTSLTGSLNSFYTTLTILDHGIGEWEYALWVSAIKRLHGTSSPSRMLYPLAHLISSSH